MSLFRLLIALTVAVAVAAELVLHLPSWAMQALGYAWVAVLLYAAIDGWREIQRDRAARLEHARYGFRR
jgi:threonine/homoserine/homoserine lactone efflux protein